MSYPVIALIILVMALLMVVASLATRLKAALIRNSTLKTSYKYLEESKDSWQKLYFEMQDKYVNLYNKTPEGLAKIARQKIQARARMLMGRR